MAPECIPERSSGADVPLDALHDVHRALLALQGGQALLQPILPGTGPRQDVDVNHGVGSVTTQ